MKTIDLKVLIKKIKNFDIYNLVDEVLLLPTPIQLLLYGLICPLAIGFGYVLMWVLYTLNIVRF
jgi:hypothetical protein